MTHSVKKAFHRKILILLLGLAVGGYAQTTGAIEGTVTDPAQAAIPDCPVKLVNQKTGVEYSIITNSAGYFLVESLPAGLYDIAVSRQGFKSAAVRGVTLDIASRVRQDIALTDRSTRRKRHRTGHRRPGGNVQRHGILRHHDRADGTAVLNGRHYARLAMLLPGALLSLRHRRTLRRGPQRAGFPRLHQRPEQQEPPGWFVDGALDA